MAGRTSYYGGIVLDGLVFHIDAAKQESYAKRGLRYMQAGNNNLFIDFADTSISPSTKNATGTIINGATFSNFAPYHLTAQHSPFWHDPSGSAWRQSAGVGTFYGNIEFDGVDDFVSFSETPDLNTTNITVSAWFYVNKFNSGGTTIIASRYNNTSTNNGWELGYNNNGVVWFGGRENSGTYISVTASILVKQTNMNISGTANGGWYNAVGTKNGNQWGISVVETNYYRHVANIAKVDKTDLKHLSLRTIQLGTGTVPFGTNSLILGRASDSNSHYMNGRLMNLSIYNRALSLSEINQNFDSFSKRIIDIEGITPLVLTCNSSIVPPGVINGVTITESSSGSVGIYPTAYSSCSGGSITTPANSKYLGQSGAFSYTMFFSSPVNNIIIAITAAGNSINENFIITTNTGTGIPVITSTINCFTTIIGNEILSGAGSTGGEGGAGGYFFISNLSPFTALTITGDGGQNGSLLSICANSLNTTVVAEPEFITKWDTTIPIMETATGIIEIPINPSYTYNYTVDWGDGIITTGHTGDATHTYATNGIYTVKITGTFPAIKENGNKYNVRMTEISQWGTTQWESMYFAFTGCTNMNVTATDAPDLSLCTNISFIFSDCLMLDANLSGWDVSTITNMSYAFAMNSNESGAIFNNGSSPMTWNTSAVTDMRFMFTNLTSFNADITSWNTTNVLYMNGMFYCATSFNQPIARNGSAWNTLQVINMNSMFMQAIDFNQNIGNWNTGAVTDMQGMFADTSAFNNGGAANTTGPAMLWDTSKVIIMQGMFANTDNFNANISSWNTILVQNMASMFQNAKKFNINIGGWNTIAVTDMSGMFYGAVSFNQYIGLWNTANVIDMQYMFYTATVFNNGNQSMATIGNSWNTIKVQNMDGMFGLSVFNQNIGNWNTIAVTNMGNMFQNNTNFNQSIGSWNTAAVTNMSGMFNGATNFNQPLTRSGNSWNTSNVTNMAYMFVDTLFNQNIGNWQVGNVLDFTNFMATKTPITFSTTNLNAIYNGWSTQTLKPNLTISFGTAKYTSAATAGRNILIGSPKLWAITDGGI